MGKQLTAGNCKEEAGKIMPVVNLNSCEGKGPCIDICPFDVFVLQEISDEQFKGLSLFGKLKTLVHGRDKAVVINAGACHACGLCVSVCPETAIKLIRNKK
jgi:4Fe-4S ferredoxin